MSRQSVPVFTELAGKIKVELDANRQVELIKQFQREAALLWPYLENPGLSTQFQLTWPWLENVGVWAGGTTATTMRPFVYYWYNKSKDPKAKPS